MSKVSTNRPGKVKSHPFLTHRELAAIALCSAILMLVSVLLDAPLEGPADPSGIPSENVKAPWIFVSIQQTLKWMSAELAGLILPFVAIMLLMFIPYFRISIILKYILFIGVIFCALTLTIWGFLS